MSKEEDSFKLVMKKFDEAKELLKMTTNIDVKDALLVLTDLNIHVLNHVSEIRREQLLEVKGLFEIVKLGDDVEKLTSSNLDSRINTLEEKVKTMSDANGFLERTSKE